MRRSLRRRAGVCAGIVASLAAPAAARAATLESSGGTLTYAAGNGTISRISFAESSDSPGTVVVTRILTGDPVVDDGDPIASAGCADVSAPDAPGTQYRCEGVTRVVADARDGDDRLSAEELATIPAELAGGAGDDDLAGGQADDRLDGGAGDDFLNGGNGPGGGNVTNPFNQETTAGADGGD